MQRTWDVPGIECTSDAWNTHVQCVVAGFHRSNCRVSLHEGWCNSADSAGIDYVCEKCAHTSYLSQLWQHQLRVSTPFCTLTKLTRLTPLEIGSSSLPSLPPPSGNLACELHDPANADARTTTRWYSYHPNLHRIHLRRTNHQVRRNVLAEYISQNQRFCHHTQTHKHSPDQSP